MTDDNSKKSKVSWPKSLLKKWFNNKSRTEEFQAEDIGLKERSARRNSERGRRGKIDLESSCDVQKYSTFVATWNVAGESPPSSLKLDDWLHASPPADIYVLGFQEIIPLNVGNAWVTKDNGPATKWIALIRKTLNSLPGTSGGYQTPSPVSDPIVELDANFEGSTSQKNPSFFHRRSFQSSSRSLRMDNDMATQQPRLDRRFSVRDRRASVDDPSYRWGSSYYENQDSPVSMEEIDGHSRQSGYCLVARKQMFGIFLTVWVKSDLRGDVRNMKISCVERGLMGHFGNKGSISISMSLHQTSFCFVCSHLTSGQKKGDERKRNSDVMEILRKTTFGRVRGMGDDNSPQTILEHDRVIWLGDLNYRSALSYRSAMNLVAKLNWEALLEKDQLRIERRIGNVFQGWSEGMINFPPTYKYSINSDRYAGDEMHSKEERKTPAWCDRILWYGHGLHQISYDRAESRLSDHRPVYSLFSVDVECINRS